MSKTADQGLSRRELTSLALGAAVLAGSGPALAQTAPAAKAAIEPTRLVSAGETLRPEIVGNFGIVAAGRHYAVAAGTRILLAGGNATDAGVAAVFAAAVTEISHFGFGGEAPTLIYDAKTKAISLVNG
ncbi:MAG: gamma-glutamyltransferase, partial [bacterium]|nr:gamma-glutamyltransferase [bacterium]